MPRGKPEPMPCSWTSGSPPFAWLPGRKTRFSSRILQPAGSSDLPARRTQAGQKLESAWYRALHDAGSRQGTARVDLSFLWREIDELTAGSIMEVASKVGGSDRPRWVTLADHIDTVKAAAMTSAETLTYNDFHWTNLALSREAKPTSAVVFDYHLLGLGLRYSDYRNATGSLGPAAAAAFRATYGKTDPREKILDDLMAPLHSLVEAFRRPRFPSWGRSSLELAESGEIHHRFERVLDILREQLPGRCFRQPPGRTASCPAVEKPLALRRGQTPWAACPAFNP